MLLCLAYTTSMVFHVLKISILIRGRVIEFNPLIPQSGTHLLNVELKVLCYIIAFTFTPGNKNIHPITSSGNYELLIELEDFQQHTKTAHYQSFSVGDSASVYTLAVSGYNGTAGKFVLFVCFVALRSW